LKLKTNNNTEGTLNKNNKENVKLPKHQVLAEKVAASLIDKIHDNKDLDSVLETID